MFYRPLCLYTSPLDSIISTAAWKILLKYNLDPVTALLELWWLTRSSHRLQGLVWPVPQLHLLLLQPLALAPHPHEAVALPLDHVQNILTQSTWPGCFLHLVYSSLGYLLSQFLLLKSVQLSPLNEAFILTTLLTTTCPASHPQAPTCFIDCFYPGQLFSYIESIYHLSPNVCNNLPLY